MNPVRSGPIIALGFLLFLASPALLPAQEQISDPAQRALHRAIEAMGGLEALRGVRSIVVTGDCWRKRGRREERGTLKGTYLAPDKNRKDYNFESERYSIILNSNRGWRKTTVDTRELGAFEVRLLQEEIEQWTERLLPAAVDGKWRVELVGSEVVDGQDVDILRFTRAQLTQDRSPDPGDADSPIKLYVDRATGNIVKSSNVIRSAAGTSVEFETVYSGFRRAGSLIQPFSAVVYANGNKVFQWNFASFEINTTVDPKVFEVGGEK